MLKIIYWVLSTCISITVLATLHEYIIISIEYRIPFWSIVLSWISICFSIFMSFLFCMFQIFGEEKTSWNRNKSILYGILVSSRFPLYISILLIYIYQKPDLSMKILSLLVTYTIDNFLFSYKMIK